MAKPWGTCECGFPCASQAEFTRHIDSHAGIERPEGWYEGRPLSRSYAQWDDNTAVMVHVDPKTGDVRYPARHEAKLKPGYERQYLRSLREVERFEQQHGVRSEMAWYDRGSGRGHDDEVCGRKETH